MHSLTGKSTLINALVGEELLPMNNVPETSRIVKVVHSALQRAQQPFLLESASSHIKPQEKRLSDSGSSVERVRCLERVSLL
jgi:ribosome biogenesis GTPase A